MAFLNLDAELNAEAEAPKRQVDADTNYAASALQAALGGRTGQAAPPKVIGMIRRAVKIMDDGPDGARKAGQICLKAIEAAPDFGLGYQAMALSLERLGRLSAAMGCYQEAFKRDPNNPDLYLNLGMVAWRLDMLDAAEKFLRLHQKLAPGAKGGVTNLAGLLRDRQKYEDSVELLRAAIYTDPENADLWNSLGTTLLESGDPEQAVTFYEEARRLNPTYSRAYHNMAFANELLGDIDQSIANFRKALTLDPTPVDKVTMEHGLSMALMAHGELEEGWALYENRLHPLYTKRVEFIANAPFWSGADPSAVRGKRLLLCGEQGLGDEVMQVAALEEALDLVGPNGAVGLVCEKRLVDFFKRSFPRLDYIGAHATVFYEGKQIRSMKEAEPAFKPDLWAPLCSLQRALRPAPEAFPSDAARRYLTADPARVTAIKAQLDALPAGLRVGFCWKSKLMTGNRQKYFSPFEMWKPVLQTPGIRFVSLQYGDTDEELARCEKDFGVTIHQIEGLDLMNDLEGVAILASLTDVSVGQVNASLALGAACGGKSLILSPSKAQWTTFGTGRLPWLPGSTLFAPETFRDWATPIGEIAKTLAQRTGAARASVA